jgi:hypothetical protein
MKKKIRSLSLLFLIFSLTVACSSPQPESTPTNSDDAVSTIVAATLSALPSPTSQPTPTDTPVPTQTATPTLIPPEPVNHSDIQSVLKWVSFAILNNKPKMLSELVGNNGVEFGGKFASSISFPGFNNADVIVSELEKGLQAPNITCKGYSVTLNARPDKADIYFSGIKTEWNNDVTGFFFFRQDSGWELVAITPIPAGQSWSNLYQTLWACP